MRRHEVVTIERQGGYAARCEVDVDGERRLCDITFGGFETRTAARAALVHEEAPAPAATGVEGEDQNPSARKGTSSPMLSPTSHTIDDGVEEYVIPASVETPDAGHFITRTDDGPWKISPAHAPDDRDMTIAEAETYAAEILQLVAFARELDTRDGAHQ